MGGRRRSERRRLPFGFERAQGGAAYAEADIEVAGEGKGRKVGFFEFICDFVIFCNCGKFIFIRYLHY